MGFTLGGVLAHIWPTDFRPRVLIHRMTAPPWRTPSITLAPASSLPFIACAYTESVVDVLACPRICATVVIGVPSCSSSEAAVCRRSWKRGLSRPARLTIPVMPADNDLPATFGRDLGTDPLADDPLVPQVVHAAVGTDAVGDDVCMEVVGIHVGSEHVQILAHTERPEEPLRIGDHLGARRVLVLGIGDV